MSSSPKRISFATPHVESKSVSTQEDTNSATTPQTTSRRRQIRVRRPRRLLRRKSTSTEVSTPRGSGGKYDDPDELLLKVNDKLSDMIEQGRAALTSTVDVTEVEMLLAEERERDERIMKELGLQTPVGRRVRKNTTDYDYYTSISDGNYSSECEYGYGTYSGHGSGFASPSGYDSPDTYTSHGHFNTPSQFGSPGIYHQPQGGFNYSNLGFSMNNNNNNNNKFVENDFNPITNRYFGPSSSNGFGDHAIPKGFGNGPISGGFGGSARFGRYGPSNNGAFGSNYGPSFGSNAGGFGSNGFGSNGGYGAGGMYNNREFLY
ncbi:hypothetical protein C1645_768616 [Glomus cerebriforme]|uniref:Uncharacterized protein n=1 Tax=Glomus cerebriforme TaxID=658196 RepID=A0A397SY48_9GLOM|nr:hypothetical protein C1645_768616 [Glomus cerebriforme]